MPSPNQGSTIVNNNYWLFIFYILLYSQPNIICDSHSAVFCKTNHDIISVLFNSDLKNGSAVHEGISKSSYN